MTAELSLSAFLFPSPLPRPFISSFFHPFYLKTVFIIWYKQISEEPILLQIIMTD